LELFHIEHQEQEGLTRQIEELKRFLAKQSAIFRENLPDLSLKEIYDRQTDRIRTSGFGRSIDDAPRGTTHDLNSLLQPLENHIQWFDVNSRDLPQIHELRIRLGRKQIASERETVEEKRELFNQVRGFAERFYELAIKSTQKQWADEKRAGRQEELLERWKGQIVQHHGNSGSAIKAGPEKLPGPPPRTPPVEKKKKVSVTIKLSQPVACPGHPLAITAVGSPGGGTYSWKVSGAELVDGAGNKIDKGDNVNLRYFHANDEDGGIPEHQAQVSVTYTHPDGTATDSKPVKVHKIEFEVTDKEIHTAFTVAKEHENIVKLAGMNGTDTMVTDPRVKIKIDASCPRKTDCARNHRVGWLQTVFTNERKARYTHTVESLVVPLPIRDGDPFTGPSPFPFYDAAPDFTDDGDKQTAHHFDSPGSGATWQDPRGDAPAPTLAKPKNRQLRQIVFKNRFTAWLVVQNKEWGLHDLKGSFAFQQHFTWEINYSPTVDMSKEIGKRCTPRKNALGKLEMTKGKGEENPNLKKATPNEEAQKPGADHVDTAPEF
jgi:hypothetical protein